MTDLTCPCLREIDKITRPILKEEYIAKHGYQANTNVELSIKKGATVLVVQKNLTGWWLVDSDEGQGFLPSSVLKNAKGVDNLKPIILEIRKSLTHYLFIIIL